MTGRLERICLERGMRMSEQRRAILHVLDATRDHPSAEEVHHRATQADPGISLATVYRTLNMLAEAGLLNRVELGDGKTHYEEAGDGRHEHLIDIETGKVLEFSDGAIEALLRAVAGRFGYRLLQYKLELFAAAEATADSLAERQARERDPRAARAPLSLRDADHHALSGSGAHRLDAASRRRPARRRNKAGAAGAG